eukprot:1109409-Rhodomonas_salina.2
MPANVWLLLKCFTEPTRRRDVALTQGSGAEDLREFRNWVYSVSRCARYTLPVPYTAWHHLQCAVLIQRVSCYARATRCPVLSWRMVLWNSYDFSTACKDAALLHARKTFAKAHSKVQPALMSYALPTPCPAMLLPGQKELGSEFRVPVTGTALPAYAVPSTEVAYAATRARKYLCSELSGTDARAYGGTRRS